MNPFIFIVGCPRSGTTLLQRLLDAHPEVAIFNQSEFIPRLYEEGRGITADGLVSQELVARVIGHHKFSRFGIDPEELERLTRANGALTYARLISLVFDLYGEGRGKRIVGDKTPRYVRKLPTLHSLWPDAKFIHLIRDGRDVCLSLLDWRKAENAVGRFAAWHEDPITTGALWWARNVGIGREDGRLLGPDLYREMRYEDLVSRPVEACTSLCEFLSVSYDDSMLGFHEGRQLADPLLDAKKAWRPITPGLRDWRSQMSAADIEHFEAAAGQMLSELGYPLVVDTPSPRALEEAAGVRAAFTETVRAQGKRLPQGWADQPVTTA
jgi:hypothetical protein